jgi:hypothetical protein
MVSTEVKLITKSMTYEINNFKDSNMNIGIAINSPIFNVFENMWLIRIFPGGKKNRGHFLSFYLVCMSKRKIIQAKYKLIIVNQKHKEDRISESCGFKEFNNSDNNSENDGWGRDEMISLNELLNPGSGFFHNGKVIFKVNIMMNDNINSILINENSLKFSMKKLLFDEESFDVFFIFPNEIKLGAHKNILSSRSIVFKSMFKSNMKESLTNEVIIEDISYETFKDLLLYIYTEEIVDNFDNLQELTYSVVKYQINNLIEICERELIKTISSDNSEELYSFASDFYLKGLKDSVELFKSEEKMCIIS